jgi:hypothetical protein
VDWGDGTTSGPDGNDLSLVSDSAQTFHVLGNHTYKEEGSYIIKVVISGNNQELDAFSTAIVGDAAIGGIGKNITATAGVQYSGVIATISDANTFGDVTDFTIRINWGDGSLPDTFNSTNFDFNFFIVKTSGPEASTATLEIHAVHTYEKIGKYTVTIAIVDKGGSTASTISNVDVRMAVGATLTADNHYALFVGNPDGTDLTFIGRNEVGAEGNPGQYNWSLPETWNFAVGAGQELFIVAWDDLIGPRGLMGQFNLPNGTLVTDSSDWVAIVGSGPNPGDYGDVPGTPELQSDISSANSQQTWQAPGGSAPNGTAPWGTIPGIASTAQFIWPDNLSGPVPSDAHYAIFRTTIPVDQVIPMTGTVTADNHYALFYGNAYGSNLTYVGRNEAGVSGNPGQFNWSLPETWSFAPPAGSYIYLVAWDEGLAPQMLIGEFDWQGKQLLTNTNDWVSIVGSGPSPGDNGLVPPTGQIQGDIAHANWTTPGGSAPDGSAPWGTIPGINPAANFIWHDSLQGADANYIILRSTQPITPVGSPPAAAQQQATMSTPIPKSATTNSPQGTVQTVSSNDQGAKPKAETAQVVVGPTTPVRRRGLDSDGFGLP